MAQNDELFKSVKVVPFLSTVIPKTLYAHGLFVLNFIYTKTTVANICCSYYMCKFSCTDMI